jgi:hypothetical protein
MRGGRSSTPQGFGLTPVIDGVSGLFYLPLKIIHECVELDFTLTVYPATLIDQNAAL